MSRRLSDIRASVRDVLLDEFVEGTDLEFEDDSLDRLIRLCLDEIEQRMPYEVKAIAFDALSTVATEQSASALSLIVASDDDFSTTYPFYITVGDEVESVTALASANTYTVSRAEKDSTAAIHAVGVDVGLTIVTTEDEQDIDISGIADVIRVLRAEYPITRPSSNPREYRNIEVFGDTLTLDISSLPDADEEVHLYLHKKHTLTDKTSTLKSQHETVLIQGVVAMAAINKGREQINALNTGGVNVGPRMIDWGREQLGLYREALRRHRVSVPYKAYSKA